MKVPHCIIAALSVLVCCALAKPKGDSRPAPKKAADTNLSHRYARAKVASFQAYEAGQAGHVLTLFVLKDGTRVPMLCKLDGENIYPIPQSVFKSGTGDEWNLIAEPLITKGGKSWYVMMMMEIKLSGDSLLVGAKGAKGAKGAEKAIVKSANKMNLVDAPKN